MAPTRVRSVASACLYGITNATISIVSSRRAIRSRALTRPLSQIGGWTHFTSHLQCSAEWLPAGDLLYSSILMPCLNHFAFQPSQVKLLRKRYTHNFTLINPVGCYVALSFWDFVITAKIPSGRYFSESPVTSKSKIYKWEWARILFMFLKGTASCYNKFLCFCWFCPHLVILASIGLLPF